MPILESIIVSVCVVALWTLAVRIFPGIIGHAVRKQIDYKYQSRLEGARGTLATGIETLRGAIDLYKTSQSELKSKQIEAVEKLWASILAYRNAFASALNLHAITKPIEIRAYVETGSRNMPAMEYMLNDYRNLEAVTDRLQQCSDKIPVGGSVLFVSSKLWRLHESLVQLYGRLPVLLAFSLRDREYRDWRGDEMLKGVFEEFRQAHELNPDTLATVDVNDVEVWLRAEFVTEAERFLSGAELPDAVQERVETLKMEALRTGEGK